MQPNTASTNPTSYATQRAAAPRSSRSAAIHASSDRLLDVFGLNRSQLGDQPRVDAARRLSQRLPTYITLKDVKKRWGRGQ